MLGRITTGSLSVPRRYRSVRTGTTSLRVLPPRVRCRLASSPRQTPGVQRDGVVHRPIGVTDLDTRRERRYAVFCVVRRSYTRTLTVWLASAPRGGLHEHTQDPGKPPRLGRSTGSARRAVGRAAERSAVGSRTPGGSLRVSRTWPEAPQDREHYPRRAVPRRIRCLRIGVSASEFGTPRQF